MYCQFTVTVVVSSHPKSHAMKLLFFTAHNKYLDKSEIANKYVTVFYELPSTSRIH